jgi:hypothetical protein
MAAYTSPFIGFAGSPRDYSSLEMARKRQSAAEEKVAKGRAQKELDDIYKMTSIDPKEYLPFRIPQIKEKFAQGVSKMVEAIAAQDYNALQEAKSEIVMFSGNFAAEKKDIDEMIKGTEGGKLYSPVNFRRFYSGSKMEDFDDMGQVGAFTVHPETGRIIPTASQNLDINRAQVDLVKQYKNKSTGELDKYGREILVLDVDAASNALYDQYFLQPAIQAKYNALNSNRISTEGKSPEQIQADLANLYVEDGLRKALPNTTRNIPKQDIYNFNLGQGGELPPALKPIELSEIKMSQTSPITGKKEVGVFNLNNSRTLGDAVATIPKGVGAYYADTGDSASDSDLQKATFNEFGNALVFSKDVTTNTPNGTVTYKKGTPILQGFESIAIVNGWAKPAMVVSAQVDGRYVLSDARRFLQTKAITASKEDTPVINQNLIEAEKDFEQFEKDFKKREADLKKAKADREKKSQGGGQPKPTQNKTTGAKPLSKEAQKRSSGNASLQKLIEQNKNQNQK